MSDTEWLTFTFRQIELLLCQLLLDLGGEVSTPLIDMPDRKVEFYQDGDRIGMIASGWEDEPDA